MTKLERMLRYVSEHNQFYKNRIKEYGIKDPLDITQWPILTRKELQENRYNMFSDGYKSKYFNQQLRRQSSSGSSGVPVNVYWDENDYLQSTISLWRLRKKYFAISPTSRKISFSLMNFSAVDDEILFYNVTDKSINFNYSCIYNDKKLIEAIEIINQFKPEWLYAQPSVLRRLLQCYKKYDITPVKSLLYIESIGELLPISLHNRLKEFFGVSVINMYGSEEHNGIAYEGPCGKMHIINDNVKVEVFSNEQITNVGEGEAIITNLINKAMPLIRYNQGDNIKLKLPKSVCSCHECSSYIEVINGRQSEIISENFGVITTFFLNEIIAETQNQYNDPISHYFFNYFKKQKKLEAWIIIDCTMKKWTSQIISSLEKNFYNKSKNKSEILFEVNVYNDIPTKNATKSKHKILNIKDEI